MDKSVESQPFKHEPHKMVKYTHTMFECITLKIKTCSVFCEVF